MNPLYQQLARTLEDIGRRVEQLQARYGEAQDESPTVAGKIRQAVANVQSGIQQLQGMLTEAAEKTTDGVPAAWDLVAVVPADQADPGRRRWRPIAGSPSVGGSVWPWHGRF